MSKHRLYALELTSDNAASTADEKYCYWSPRRILVYAEKQPKESTEIKFSEDASSLEAPEALWLLESVEKIMKERLQQKEQELRKAQKEMAKKLDAELQKEVSEDER